MGRKKKSSNHRLIAIAAIAALAYGGYYWLNEDTQSGTNKHIDTTANEQTPKETTPSAIDNKLANESVIETDTDASNPEEENNLSNQKKTPVTPQPKDTKDAYVDNFGNVIYTHPEADQPLRYKSYRQTRWGYTVNYPSFLTKETYSQNNDGAIFEDGKGIKLTTYGIWNVLGESIQNLYDRSVPDVRSVTYHKLFRKQKSYVKSGFTKDNRIYYIKEAIIEKDGDELIVTLMFTYPKWYKKQADKVIRDIFVSFPRVR